LLFQFIIFELLFGNPVNCNRSGFGFAILKNGPKKATWQCWILHPTPKAKLGGVASLHQRITTNQKQDPQKHSF
jgi:hypothetical protein